jgi:tripartite-type tricarboxylate transporter receptor subunit TctC
MAMKKEKNLKRGMVNRRDFLKISGLSVGTLAMGELTQIPFSFAKEVYPSGKLIWLIGLPPGGGIDTASRAVSPFMEKYLKAVSSSPNKVGVVINNLIGGDGMRALNKLHQSEPDGYTIMGANEKLISWAVGGKLSFDAFELTLIGKLGGASKVLATNKKSNLHTWDDVIKASKKAPIDISVAGFGSSNHLAAIFLIEAAKLEAKPIVASGSSESIAALMRGDVPIGIYPVDTLKRLIDANEVRPLLTLTNEKYFGVPNAKEIGFPELIESTQSQRYVIAPPKLPASIKKTLVDALKKTVADKEFLALNEKVGLGIDPVIGPEFDQMFKDVYNFFKTKEKLIREYI